jgi:hypothetical protein
MYSEEMVQEEKAIKQQLNTTQQQINSMKM